MNRERSRTYAYARMYTKHLTFNTLNMQIDILKMAEKTRETLQNYIIMIESYMKMK